jgi:hypothetical protein
MPAVEARAVEWEMERFFFMDGILLPFTNLGHNNVFFSTGPVTEGTPPPPSRFPARPPARPPARRATCYACRVGRHRRHGHQDGIASARHAEIVAFVYGTCASVWSVCCVTVRVWRISPRALSR